MTRLRISDQENHLEKPIAKGEGTKNALFGQEMLDGLQASPKRLPAKYFYDAPGDRIFQEIMHCQEYYLFNCEMEVFREQTAELARAILSVDGAFDLIELGAGDCAKSSYLLNYLVGIKADFIYIPIDISSNSIDYLTLQLPITIPGIQLRGLNGEYFAMLDEAVALSKNRKVVFFLGSTLGNMPPADAELFCRELREFLRSGDLALIGLDLKKCPHTVLAAYHDQQGITRRFNFNLLERMNRELEANFDVTQFTHFPLYDPESGGCKSYLVSRADQDVTLTIQGVNETIRFAQWEAIFTEISQKYTVEQVHQVGKQAGFETIGSFFDSQRWFIDTLWAAV